MINLKGYAILGAIILVASGMGYWYFSWSQNRISSLKEEMAALKIENQMQEKTIISLKNDADALKSQYGKIIKVQGKTEQDIIDLYSKFNKVSPVTGERDIGKLATAKPKSIERIVNKGTLDANRCYEIISGAPLTEEEENATKLSQANRMCPDLANPNLVR